MANITHVSLVTKETLCGHPQVPRGGVGLFFDGVNGGPVEDITCGDCKSIYSHAMGCSICLSYLQRTTTRLVFESLERLHGKGGNENLADAVEADLAHQAGAFNMKAFMRDDHAAEPLTPEAEAFGESLLRRQSRVGVGREIFRSATRDAALEKMAKYKKNAPAPSPPKTTNQDPNTVTEENTDMSSNAAAPVVRKLSLDEEAAIRDVDVDRQGGKIIVPEGMDYNVAIAALKRRAAEEEQDINVNHDFDFTPPEGAIALLRTLKELYNFVSALSNPGFFGPRPPVFMSIETGVGTTESVPWGNMAIPGVTGYVTTSIYWVDGTPRFRLSGVVRGKDKAAVQKIADHMRQRTDSLYRGKAIRAAFPEQDDNTTLEDFFPKFMELPKLGIQDLIFSDEIQDLIDTALFTPIEHAQACRDNGISLKRGILLEGPFGVGKTLTATVTARKCVENGWTFIYLKTVEDLPRAIHFAKGYQPAVIFAEDIDQVLSDPDQRDEQVNEILNSSDGIDTKGLEIITVLTTNNVDKITTAMLRPGRLDTIVQVRAPDANAAIRLVKLFAGDQLAADQDFTQVGELLAGCIPAMIQEAVKRSKLGAVRRAARGGKLEITARDVEIAAISMVAHMKLLEVEKPDTRSDAERAAGIYGNSLGEALAKVVETVQAGVPAASKTVPNGKTSTGASATS